MITKHEYNSEIKISIISSVKSRYTLKKIFSYIYENQKLSILAHNKKLQRLFNIDIDYYRKISGKILIGDINGEGKEYKLNTDIIIFSGKYLKGKRQGKGEEYYSNGNLKFEGEYSKGKIIKGIGYNQIGNIILEINNNGKGKEYYSNGLIQFEGEYINGKRWNGKGYNNKGILEYEIKNGKGLIKEYDYYGKLIYDGEYINGKRYGKGIEYEKRNNNEEPLNEENKGIQKKFSYNHGLKRFEGDFKNGEKNGNIKIFNYLTNKLIFEGEYINNEKNGFGKEYNNYGDLIFTGEYKNSIRNGKGKEYFNNGKISFNGEYLNGKKYNGNGYDINGELKYEIREGEGNVIEYDYDGKKIFEGEYKNGERNGHGKEFIDNEILSYEGEYENGKRNGNGKEYYIDGEFNEVEYENGIEVYEDLDNDSFLAFSDDDD